MFDFSRLGDLPEIMAGGVRDIDSRLQSIEYHARLQTVLLAMIVCEQYRIGGGGNPGGYAADLQSVLATARDHVAAGARQDEP